jgi:hypothetical protein
VDKKNNKYSTIRKIFLTMSLGFLALSFGSLMLLKRLNYLYQLNYALVMGLVINVLCLDFENIIHNYIYSSLKNVFKIRKNKIFIFLVILSANILAILVYNIINSDAIEIISEIEKAKLPCTEFEKMSIGSEATFMEITYIYGFLGAYWGTSLTIEKNCGQWWDSGFKNSFKKLLITSILAGLYLWAFSNNID